MEGDASQAGSVATASRVQGSNEVLAGVKIFLADVGASFLLGFITGMFLAAAKFSLEEIAESPFLPILGLFISIYLAYVLYRRYSQENLALAALLSVGAFWALLNVYVSATNTEGYNLQKHLLFFAAQMLAYLIGWHLAKMTDIRIYIPKKWRFTASGILGGIVLLFSLVGMVALISA